MPESAAATEATVSRRLPTPSQWDQQPGENDLWFSRFMRFVALGPGRSVSLVATGRRNAYPIPAHWPIQAKQNSWRERASAFDAAAKANPRLITAFNERLAGLVEHAPNGEGPALNLAVSSGGYQTPPPDEDYEDEPRRTATR